MDQNALKFINNRQATLRDAYNAYKLQFRPTSSNEIDKRWAWGRWTDVDVDKIITECLEKERKSSGTADTMEVERKLKKGLQRWIRAFLSDTGSMFRLYRKTGFDVDKAIPALRATLEFRIQQRREMLWSPISYETALNSSYYAGTNAKSSPPRTSRRSSASSRTSAQSPRSSPAPEWETTQHSGESNHLPANYIGGGASGPTDTLLQLYPPSSDDPNRRPIIVVSLRHLDIVSESLKEPNDPVRSEILSTPPKTQALAAFERLRYYLAESISLRDDEPGLPEPLQFILIIDLAGGRVSGTAWDMVKWLVRDGADQFHGMCSAVFVVNYSWEFGALWSFIKHVLPAPAKARVIFPTVEELVTYLGDDVLPPSLGGSCASTLPYYPAPFEATEPRVKSPNTAGTSPSPILIHSPVSSSASEGHRQLRRTALKHFHATSRENPYYGYPATIEEGVDDHGRPVRIQHSRRRKRDLIRTLCWLLLLRCRERIAYLPWQLRNLSRRLFYNRCGMLVLTMVLAMSVSVGGVKEWKRLRARWSPLLAFRLS